ncbi:MAG TPA: hypothetical protein VGF19_08470 [Candidatus Acidoferrum sp.]
MKRFLVALTLAASFILPAVAQEPSGPEATPRTTSSAIHKHHHKRHKKHTSGHHDHNATQPQS